MRLYKIIYDPIFHNQIIKNVIKAKNKKQAIKKFLKRNEIKFKTFFSEFLEIERILDEEYREGNIWNEK